MRNKNEIILAVFLCAVLSIPASLFAADSGSDQAGSGDTMALIKGGCFDMGDTFAEGDSDELPVHRVCVDDFQLDKYEVTHADFMHAMGKEHPHHRKGCPECPIEGVSWQSANGYCTSSGKRLPTEAEWEYAAREGGKKVRFGNGKDILDPGEANFFSRNYAKKPFSRIGKYRKKSLPVGSFPPSELGLYDMSGNAWEWVNDWYNHTYYGVSSEKNPKGPESGKYRVMRGGSWISFPGHLRASNRLIGIGSSPVAPFSHVGFRCAR